MTDFNSFLNILKLLNINIGQIKELQNISEPYFKTINFNYYNISLNIYHNDISHYTHVQIIFDKDIEILLDNVEIYNMYKLLRNLYRSKINFISANYLIILKFKKEKYINLIENTPEFIFNKINEIN